jgi:DNA-directed RNA polymerase specialized sigma24 family protein
VRRKGIGPHEAEDLTQDFFAARVVTRLIFHGVASGRGKFRTWLLNCFQNFLHNEWDKRQAKKRGGGHAHVPLDLEGAETRYSLEPAHNETPERCYERTWLLTLLDHALTALENRFKQADQAALFNELKGFLPGVATPPSFAEVAERLGKSEAAVKMAVSRFKREYGEVLTLEIRRTVSNLEEFNDELRHLITVVSD